MAPMSTGFGVFIMMNNYFHDVATVLLVACSAALWLVLKRAGEIPGPEVAAYLRRVHRKLSWVFRFSIAWIILSGIPRVIYYKDFEWANAVEHHIVTALMVKHTLAVIFITSGATVWIILSRKVRQMTGDATSA